MGNTLANPALSLQAVARACSLARLYGTDFYSGAGPSRKPQATSGKRKKDLTKIVNRGTIPYNLKKGIK